MDKAWVEMIKQNVYEKLQTVEFNHPDFNLKEFKSELKTILGVLPSVQLKWDVTEKINELKKNTGDPDFLEKNEKVKQIDITFADTDNKPVVFKFLI